MTQLRPLLTIATLTLTVAVQVACAPVAKLSQVASSQKVPDWVTRAIENQKNAPGSATATPAPPGTSSLFEENRGQFAGDAEFIGRDMAGGTVVLGRSGFSMLFMPAESSEPARSRATVSGVTHRLTVSFADASQSSECQGQDPASTRFAYFRGSDPKKWITNVATYRSMICPAVFRNIDFVASEVNGGFEYGFLVAPGADPNSIQMRLSGADKARLDDQGNLLLTVGKSEIRHARPVSFQTIGGKRVPVESNFVLENSVLRVNVGAYDKSVALTIDPTVTQLWQSQLAGGPFGHSHGRGIAVGPNGMIYEAGSVNVFSSMTAFSQDAFMTLRDAAGSIRFGAVFTGSGSCVIQIPNMPCDGADEALAIAVDSAAWVYLTGRTTSLNFPILNAVDSTCGDDTTCTRGADPSATPRPDAFVLRLVISPVVSGGTIFVGYAPDWGTYLGGAGTDVGTGIAVDSAGRIFVSGDTNGDFTTTDGSTGFTPVRDDGFLVAYAQPPGTTAPTLLFSTRIGGSSVDAANAVAANDSFVFVAGRTCSTDFGGSGPFLTLAGNGGGCEAYVLRYDKTGKRLNNTLLQGSGDDSANALALDAGGSVYVAGATTSTNFVGSSTPKAGGIDGFLAKLTYSDLHLIHGGTFTRAILNYSLLFGGSNDDIANGVAVDSQNRAYVVGSTRSSNFPIVGTPVAPFSSTNAGGLCGIGNLACPDALLLRVSSGGSLDYSALWGGNSYDSANAVALRADNDVVFTTEQFQPNLTIPQYFAIAVRAVSGSDLSLTKSCSPNPVHAGSTLTCTLTKTNLGPEDAPWLTIVDRPQQPAQFDITAPSSSSCLPQYDLSQRIDHITCTTGPLQANHTATYTDQLLPLVSGSFTDVATIAYGNDWNPGNNSASSTVQVIADSNLSVFKYHTPDPSPLGSDVSYTIWSSNNGPDVASDVTLTEQFPSGMDLISVTTPNGDCSPMQGAGPLTITCHFGILTHIQGPSGTSAVGVTVVARPNAAGVYTNTATVSGKVSEVDPSDNQMTDTTNVIVGRPIIKLQSNLFSNRPGPGGSTANVEVEIRNVGDGNAQAVTVAQINAVAITGTGTIVTLSALPAPIPLLGPGKAKSIVAQLQIPTGVTSLNFTVTGTYMDFSGSTTALPFGGSATLTP